jgi:hypothetical protein
VKRLPFALFDAAQIPLLSDPGHKWIESPEADPITVPREVFCHFELKNRAFDSVIKDVKPNQAGVKIAILKAVFVIAFLYRNSIAFIVIRLPVGRAVGPGPIFSLL